MQTKVCQKFAEVMETSKSLRKFCKKTNFRKFGKSRQLPKRFQRVWVTFCTWFASFRESDRFRMVLSQFDKILALGMDSCRLGSCLCWLDYGQTSREGMRETQALERYIAVIVVRRSGWDPQGFTQRSQPHTPKVGPERISFARFGMSKGMGALLG